MVGLSAVCWALWKSRNSVCFGKKKQIRSPTEVICLASSFATYWAGLQKQGIQEGPGDGRRSFERGGTSLSSARGGTGGIRSWVSTVSVKLKRRWFGEAGTNYSCRVGYSLLF